VSTSGYNDWLDRPESQRSLENKALTVKIKHSHEQSGEVYGAPKIHKDLIADGETCSENRVTRLMSTKNDAVLVQDALTMAIWRRGKVNDIIVHSDQGSTYASGSYH